MIVFGLLFFLTSLLPVIQIVPLPGFSITAERYAYLPYMGLFLLLGWIVHQYLIRKSNVPVFLRYLSFSLIAASMVFFSISTHQRSKVWKDSISLFSDVIRKYPDLAMAYNNRGLAFAEAGVIR